MKKLYVLLLTYGMIINASGQNWTYDDFDGNTNWPPLVFAVPASPPGLWQIGRPNKPIFDSAFSPVNVIVTDTVAFYPINTVSSFMMKYKGISPFSPILAIHWMQKIDFGSGDGGVLEFSTDNGASWQNAFNNPLVYNFYGFQPANADTLSNGQFCFGGRDSVWRNVWLCFASNPLWSLTQDTIALRYTLVSDSVHTDDEGWMIDDFNLHYTFTHTVDEPVMPNLVNIYPNPVAERLHIRLDKVSQHRFIENMQVVDATGRLVQKWGPLPPKYWIDVRGYKPGLYKLIVQTNVGGQCHSFVVE